MTDLEDGILETPALPPAPTPRRGKGWRDFRADFKGIVSREAMLFHHQPILYGAVALVSFIPALYCVIYLSSVWNPLGNLQNLPAGVVNLDQPTTYQGKEVHIGQDVLGTLKTENTFKFKTYSSETEVKAALNKGEVYFAVVLPSDLSTRGVRGKLNERATLTALYSEGTSYTASSIGKRFVTTLADGINVQLNEKRFAGVLGGQQTLESGLSQLRQGAKDLLEGANTLSSGAGKLKTGASDLSSGLNTAQNGAGQLSSGASTLSGNVSKLTDGVDKLRGGVETISSKLPSSADLDKLSSGAAQVSSGNAKLASGLGQLSSGSAQLAQKSAELSSGIAKLGAGAKTLSSGATNLNSGLGKLSTGATQVSSGVSDLSSGLNKLSSGASGLVKGSSDLSSGLKSAQSGATGVKGGAADLSSGLSSAQAGSVQLAQGAAQLSSGLGGAALSVPSLKPLSDGAVQLSSNAQKLSKGLEQLKGGSAQLAAGSAQLETGVKAASSGAAQLQAGAVQLQGGLNSASSGSQKLVAGSAQLETGLGSASQGAAQLQSGATQLSSGLNTASSGSVQLAQGAKKLSSAAKEASSGAQSLQKGSVDLAAGITRLTDGTQQLKTGVNTLESRFPKSTDLQKLSSGARTLALTTGDLSSGLGKLADGGQKLKDGSSDLAEGASKLTEGARKLYDAVPANLEGLSGDAAGLAFSVDSKEVAVNSVPNNGTAFAPYFIALALWVGATTTTFVFHYRMFPSSLKSTRQGARVLGKAVFPGLTLLIQALIIALSMRFVLGIPVPDWGGFLTVLLVGVFTFLCIFMALITLLGDAGRLVALILMVFQLGASGGSYPIELLPEAFQKVHNLLPITDMVKALRAVLFGSYDGDWRVYALRMMAVGGVSLLIALLFGRRWRFMPNEQYGPAINI